MNNPRARGYARTASQIPNPDGDPYCDIRWHIGDECDTLQAALEDELPYEAGNMPDVAPWWSNGSPFQAGSSSRKFLGIYGLAADMLSDSTRQASVTEGINNGGVIGTSRRAVRGVTFRVLLTGLDEDGLEYGMAWLTRALNEASGSKLTPSCGAVDLTFFTTCPPAYDPAQGIDLYRDRIRSITRVLHDVKAVSGPIVREKLVTPDNIAYGYIVEFTLNAGVPFIFGIPNDTFLVPNVGEVVISDIVYNLQQYPSAEVAGADIVVATNWSTNPSVETNTTGWALTAALPWTTALLTGARSTELSAVGTASYRVLAQPTAAGSTGSFGGQQTVTGLPTTAGLRFSVSMWAAVAIQTGTPTIDRIEIWAYWQTGAPTTLRSDLIGTVDPNGGVASKASILPPAGATQVLVRAMCYPTSYSAGDAIRLYIDALAVTTP